MLPAGAADNRVKGRSLYPKLAHKRTRLTPLASIAAAYLSYLSVGQLGALVSHPDNSGPSTRVAISGVVFVSSQNQVRRINAQSCVARMADNQSIRNDAIHKLISDAMCRRGVFENLKRAVAALTLPAALPNPAFINLRLGNTFPEPLRQNSNQILGQMG